MFSFSISDREIEVAQIRHIYDNDCNDLISKMQQIYILPYAVIHVLRLKNILKELLDKYLYHPYCIGHIIYCILETCVCILCNIEKVDIGLNINLNNIQNKTFYNYAKKIQLYCNGIKGTIGKHIANRCINKTKNVLEDSADIMNLTFNMLNSIVDFTQEEVDFTQEEFEDCLDDYKQCNRSNLSMEVTYINKVFVTYK
jgi:hypothetical protein